MQYTEPLETGLFLKRYKRFFADIDWNGETVVAHVPNTGSLKGCLNANSSCRFSVSNDPKRKLKYTLQMIQTSGSWVGVNTAIANSLVWEAWEKRQIPTWKEFDGAQREVKINDKSRLDLVLWRGNENLQPGQKISLTDFKSHKFHFVEVKNVTLAEDGTALFPDAVTTRGQKHLEELMDLCRRGHSSEIVFVVQRTDCDHFSPADAIDPEYGRLLREANKCGVSISAYPCHINEKGVVLNGAKPLVLKFP